MNNSITMSTMDSGVPTNGSAGTSTIDRRVAGLRSPMSLSGNLGASTLSMRAKAARKRRINAQHNSNFRAGFVPVEEDLLQRSGIRGRKRYMLYCVVASLLIVTLVNLALTAWLLHILGMAYYGISNIEFLTLGGRDFMRVLTDARMTSLSMNRAPLGARFNSSLEIQTEEEPLKVTSGSNSTGSSIILDGPNLTMITKEFCVKTKGSSDWISANLQSLVTNTVFNNMYTDTITVPRIHGMQYYKDFYLENLQNATDVSGYSGVYLAAKKDINVTAPYVSLNTKESIKFAVNGSMYLKPEEIPRAGGTKVRKTKKITYKVCICTQTGRLYLVQAHKGVSCDIGDDDFNSICGSPATRI